MIDVIPGINEPTLEEIERKIDLVVPHTPWVHIDFLDETLFPNTSYMDIEKLKPLIDRSGLSFEAHLMVGKPEKYLKALADAGFKRVIIHVECDDPRLFLDEAQYESIEVGIAIDAATEIEALDPFLEEVDVALVMTVEAGASGAAFMPETVDKVRIIKEHFPTLVIEVDGGINDKTASVVREAGATRLVSTTYVFNDPTMVGDHLEQLRG
jgi:ribulose-phosphate 3-epimerase